MQSIKMLNKSLLGAVAVVLGFAWCTRIEAAVSAYGIQSTDTANSFGASMIYDSALHRIYLTGATYGHYFDSQRPADDPPRNESDCFVAILQLPLEGRMDEPQWLQRTVMGTPGVQDACSALTMVGQSQTRHIYILGHARDSPGALSTMDALNDEDRSTRVYGTVFDLAWDGSLKGGFLQESSTVQYPVGIDSVDGFDLFVGSIFSNTTTEDNSFSSWKRVQGDQQPDTTTSGGYLPPQFGSNFSLSLRRLRPTESKGTIPDKTETIASPQSQGTSNSSLDRSAFDDIRQDRGESTIPKSRREAPNLQRTLDEVWRKNFTTGEGFSVQLATVKTLSNQKVLVAGSTRGSGEFFGGQKNENAMDGFLAVVHPRTSTLMDSIQIQSQQGNDRVLGLCTFGSSDIYIVGMTDGNLLDKGKSPPSLIRSGYYQAFIQRIDSETLQTYWTYQLGGLHPYEFAQVHGIACAVTPDGSHVYMAGTVKDGAVISVDGKNPNGFSAGQDDVFVAQLFTKNGTISYAQQFGTSRDDTLGNGDSLLCDKDGNAVVLVNTKGSLLRNKTAFAELDVTDVVIMSLDRNTGDHETVVEIGDFLSDVQHEPQNQELLSKQIKMPTLSPSQQMQNKLTESPIIATLSTNKTATGGLDTSTSATVDDIQTTPSPKPWSITTDQNDTQKPTMPDLTGVFPTSSEEYTTSNTPPTIVVQTTSKAKAYVVAMILMANVILVGCITILLTRRRKFIQSTTTTTTPMDKYANLYESSDDDGSIRVTKSATGGYKCTYHSHQLIEDRLEQERLDRHAKVVRPRYAQPRKIHDPERSHTMSPRPPSMNAAPREELGGLIDTRALPALGAGGAFRPIHVEELDGLQSFDEVSQSHQALLGGGGSMEEEKRAYNLVEYGIQQWPGQQYMMDEPAVTRLEDLTFRRLSSSSEYVSSFDDDFDLDRILDEPEPRARSSRRIS
jgi:hypothetical protein